MIETTSSALTLHHSGGSVLLGLVEEDLPFLLVCIFAIIILLISLIDALKEVLRAEVISLPIITDQYIDRETSIRHSEQLHDFSGIPAKAKVFR